MELTDSNIALLLSMAVMSDAIKTCGTAKQIAAFNDEIASTALALLFVGDVVGAEALSTVLIAVS
jgi:hypothetical protein